MTFALHAIRDDITYGLTGGTPFALERAEGLAWPDVQRVTLRAPGQDGDRDTGYYLEPRIVTLALHFYADSGSALDAYRDTFNTIFRPSRLGGFSALSDSRYAAEPPITLRVTRDDGAVRQMGVYTTGAADIALVPGHAAKRLHRAVVQLVAPNPVWQGTAGTVLSYTAASTATIFGTLTYPGTYHAQPTLYITGEGTSPVITNTTTGATLNFTGVALPGTTSLLVVDTARRVATLNGAPVQPVGGFNDFRLAPGPVATGGTNVVTVTWSNKRFTAQLSVQYVSQFVGY